MSLSEDLHRQEEEILARRAELSGDQFDKATDELMEVRRRRSSLRPDRGPELIGPDIHKAIARMRAELDGYLGPLD